MTETAERLVCTGCGAPAPVRDGILRFTAELDPLAARTQASFGYEWTVFADWSQSGQTNFREYFGDLDLDALAAARVLDAGCGMGRHARQIAPHVKSLVALDFSAAIDQAAATLRGMENVLCLQADITAPPLRPEAFDFVYSLGVLHHLRDTHGALAGLVRLVRPGGRLRVYLYWQPSGWRSALLRVVNSVRPVTTRMPFPLLRACCWVLSAGLWATVLLAYRVLSRAGVRRVSRLPLFQYTKYPFAVLYNDQFDRLSAPLEKRYRKSEVEQLLGDAGLVDVRVWPRYGWIAEGTRPGRDDRMTAS